MLNKTQSNSNNYNKNFENIVVTNDQIENSEFDNCNFKKCNFSEVTFKKCKFYECEFIDCNLSNAVFNYTSLFDTIFDGCKLVGVNWTSASWPNIIIDFPLKFYKSNLSHSSFYNLNLIEATMIDCLAKEVDFRETNCSNADFSGTDFTGSLFTNTNLRKANFTDASNYSIDVFNNNIEDATFNLPEALSLLSGLKIRIS